MKFLSVRETEDIAYVSLENPTEFNALSQKLMEELKELLFKMGQEKAVKVVIIEGAKKAFCVGHSLKEVETKSDLEVMELFRTCESLMKTMRDIPQIIISKVEGVAVAAGSQLVAASDLAVASDQARFGVPGINSGLFCSTPAVFVSRNIGRKKAAELLFTGNLMSATEAEREGLVNKVVPADELNKVTDQLAKDITKQSLNILAIGKRQFYEQLNMEDFQALNYATEVIVRNSQHPDAKEGIRAFFEKRTPIWPDK